MNDGRLKPKMDIGIFPCPHFEEKFSVIFSVCGQVNIIHSNQLYMFLEIPKIYAFSIGDHAIKTSTYSLKRL